MKIKNILLMYKEITKASKSRIFFSIVYAFFSSLSPIINVISIKYIIDMINLQNSLVQIINFIILMCSLYIISALYIVWYDKSYTIKSNNKIVKYIEHKVYCNVSRVDLNYYDNEEYYNSFTKVIKETSFRMINGVSNLIGVIKSLFVILGIISLILILDAPILIIIVITVFLSVVISSINSKLAYKKQMEMTKVNREKDYIKRVFYLKNFAKDLKFFAFHKYFLNKHEDVMKNNYLMQKKYINKFFAIDIAQWSVTIVSIFGTMGYLAFRILRGILSLGDFAGLLNSSQELTSGIQQLFMFIPKMIEDSYYMENYDNFLKIESKVENSNNENENYISFNKSIDINNVSFSYDDNKEILSKINLSIKRGNKIGIVGHNGAGKTTLINLIVKFYNPTSGNLSIDNVDYSIINAMNIRKKIGVIFQDFQIFAIPIADNILMRKCESKNDEEQVIKVLKRVNLFEKINSLKNGIYTNISKEFDQEGVIFSGGELQKIAIARAIVANPEILIFDEMSSALDPIAEYELTKEILENFKDKTIIIISHRLYTTKECDNIIVLENGHIIEEGNHADLMDRKGQYYEMYNTQSKQYIE